MRVSIVIPTYNNASSIGRSVRSAFAQSHKDIEVICVNDGSTDDTSEELSKLQNEYALLKVIQQENKGGGAARNAGLSAAHGDYIQFLDADDELLPDKITSDLDQFGVDRPAVVFGAMQMVNDHGDVLETRSPDLSEGVWVGMMRTKLGQTSAMLWHKETAVKAGGWDETLTSSQEYDLLLRVLVLNPHWVVQPEPMVKVEEREDSVSRNAAKQAKNWLNYATLRKRILDTAMQVWPEGETALYSALFDAVRTWSMHDRKAAAHFFRQHFPKGYRPVVSPVTGKTYIRLFRILGFSLTERLLSLKR